MILIGSIVASPGAYFESKTILIELEEKERLKQQAKNHAKSLLEWRGFKRQTLYSRIGFDYLRKNGDYFETSQGVKIPVNIGIRFYNNIKKGVFVDNFLGYNVSEITKKYICIGCHKITFKEIESVIK